MGNRVSIQFENKGKKSVVLFSHWDGMDFVNLARKYIKELKKEVKGKVCYPLERLEPNTVMMDFIRKLTKDMKRVECNYYLGATESNGDNSDNGHHIIELGREE